MRSLKTGIFTFAVVGLFGTAAVIGCGADGSGDEVVQDPGAPTDPEGSQLPGESNPGTSSSGGTKDAGKDAKTDAAKVDSGKDAGPPPPNPGDACPTANAIFTKSCGKCGQAQAICEADPDGGAGGKVSQYGACLNETGVCEPGTMQTVACGNCGTKTQTCNQYCGWGSATCMGEPTNSCSPGGYEYTAAGCPMNQYRKRDCQQTCTWTNYAACAEPVNSNILAISGTVNGTASGVYALTTTQQAKRGSGYGCGTSAYIGTSTNYPTNLVEIRNNTAKTATIDIGGSGANSMDVVYDVYPTTLPPQSDTEIKACTYYDESYSSTSANMTGIMMPAGAHWIVRFSSYYESTNTFGETTTGNVTITIKTTALN